MTFPPPPTKKTLVTKGRRVGAGTSEQQGSLPSTMKEETEVPPDICLSPMSEVTGMHFPETETRACSELPNLVLHLGFR